MFRRKPTPDAIVTTTHADCPECQAHIKPATRAARKSRTDHGWDDSLAIFFPADGSPVSHVAHGAGWFKDQAAWKAWNESPEGRERAQVHAPANQLP